MKKMNNKKKSKNSLRYFIPVIYPISKVKSQKKVFNSKDFDKITEKSASYIEKASSKIDTGQYIKENSWIPEDRSENDIEDSLPIKAELQEILNSENFFLLPTEIQINKMLEMDLFSIQNLCTASSLPEEYSIEILTDNPEKISILNNICKNPKFGKLWESNNWIKRLEKRIDPKMLKDIFDKSVIESKTTDPEFWKQEYNKATMSKYSLNTDIEHDRKIINEDDSEDDSEDDDIIVLI